MLKLTRLNNQVVVVNPDLVYAVDATPDTTLRLVGGDRIIVRESLDELISKVVEYRRRVNRASDTATTLDTEGDVGLTLRHGADAASGATEVFTPDTYAHPRAHSKGDE